MLITFCYRLKILLIASKLVTIYNVSSGQEKEGALSLHGITINDLAPPSMNSLDALFCDIDNFCQKFEPN